MKERRQRTHKSLKSVARADGAHCARTRLTRVRVRVRVRAASDAAACKSREREKT